MELYISNSGQEPIYAQITRQIKAKILNGELQQGDALPSIRLLAKELRISVITTKRAYEDLEADCCAAKPGPTPGGKLKTDGRAPAARH